MSLRARILLSILAVNVAVTVVLAWFLARDLADQDEQNRRRDQTISDEYLREFEQLFDGILTINAPPGGEEETRNAVRALRRHPVRRFVRDAVILQYGMLDPTKQAEDAELPANALY